MNNESQTIEEKINSVLDSSIDDLPADVRRGLNQAKAKATEGTRYIRPIWKAASVFSFLVVAFFGWQMTEQPMAPQDFSRQDSMFADVLQEDPEMLDDLELIYWMSESEQDASL